MMGDQHLPNGFGATEAGMADRDCDWWRKESQFITRRVMATFSGFRPHFSLQPFYQFLTSAEDAAADGAERDVEDLGDLLV